MSHISDTRRRTWANPVDARSDRARHDAAQHVKDHQQAEHRMLIIVGLAVSVLVPMIACALVFGPWIEWTPDGFHYLALARSLAETGGFPNERITTPPGFPLLLAPLMSSGDLPIAGVRVLLAGGFISTCVLTFLLYRRLIGEGWAIAAAMMTGLSVTLLVQSTTLLSESIYLPMSLLALLILTRWSKTGPTGFSDLAWGGIAVAGAWAVRSTGLLLVPVAAWTAFRGGAGGLGPRFGRALLVIIIATAPVFAWELRQSSFGAKHGYFDSLLRPRTALGEGIANPSRAGATAGHADAKAVGTAPGATIFNAATLKSIWEMQVERFRQFGPQRMRDLAAAIVPPHVGWRFLSGDWALPAACLISVAVLVAALHGLFRHCRPADAYLILYVALLAVWPWKEGPRLMMPLVPICIGYAACAGRRMWETRGRLATPFRVVSIGGTACAVLVLCWEEKLTVTSLRNRASVSQARMLDMQIMGDWLEGHVKPDQHVQGLVPEGSTAKLTLLGGRYLARRDVRVDDSPAADIVAQAPDAVWRLVHRSMFVSSPSLVRGPVSLGEFVAIKTNK